MDDRFEGWKGKKVFLMTKSNRRYSGFVKETTEHFIFILDKFSNNVTISISEISSIEEEK